VTTVPQSPAPADRPLLLDRANVYDPVSGQYTPNRRVTIAAGRITAVDDAAEAITDGVRADVIDLGGRPLLPGLIDAHVHTTFWTADVVSQSWHSPSYTTARAAQILRGMVHRGFTTVRDVGGADFGLSEAIEEGLLEGPRLRYAGRILSQTGGHGDLRARSELGLRARPESIGVSVLADGVPEVRRAAREELAKGAHHIKMELSGGVGSPHDRIDSTQYSEDEIRAVVDEAQAANRYVCGHAYTARSVNRALRCGVRSIEHGNGLDDESVELFLARGAFLVPTLITYAKLAEQGEAAGLPPASAAKLSTVLQTGLDSLRRAHEAGVQIAFGTDLLGSMHGHQLDEFLIRTQVQSMADVLRSATVVAARLLGMEHEVGRIAPGYRADLLVYDRDPVADPAVITRPDEHLQLILKAGDVVADRLP
jgi:imidazolonepropionase-like amidohydrolase